MRLEIDSVADQAILDVLRQGRWRDAAGLLVRYHATPVYRLCHARAGDRERAEDLTHESFARAFRALGDLHGGRSPRDWLLMVAGQACDDANVGAAAASGPLEGGSREGPQVGEGLRRRLEILAAAL